MSRDILRQLCLVDVCKHFETNTLTLQSCYHLMFARGRVINGCKWLVFSACNCKMQCLMMHTCVELVTASRCVKQCWVFQMSFPPQQSCKSNASESQSDRRFQDRLHINIRPSWQSVSMMDTDFNFSFHTAASLCKHVALMIT